MNNKAVRKMRVFEARVQEAMGIKPKSIKEFVNDMHVRNMQVC